MNIKYWVAAGRGQWERLEHSIPTYFSADPAWPWKCYISPKVRAAFLVPWRAGILSASYPHLL